MCTGVVLDSPCSSRAMGQSCYLRFGNVKKLTFLTTAVFLVLLDVHINEAFKLDTWVEGYAEQEEDGIGTATYSVKMDAKKAQLFCKLTLEPGDSRQLTFSWELVPDPGQWISILAKSSASNNVNIISAMVSVDEETLTRVAQCVVRAPPKYFGVDWFTVTVRAAGGRSTWSQWSTCTPSCGQQRHTTRTRSCFNPWSEPESEVCPGVDTQNLTCSDKTCNVDPPSVASATVRPRRPSARLSEEYNLRIIVACSSGLIGSLLLSAVLACWRRLHLEQIEHRRQLMQPEATEPRYHGLSEQSAMRPAPPPTYHETFQIDVSRVLEVDRSATPLSRTTSPASVTSTPSVPATAGESPEVGNTDAASANADGDDLPTPEYSPVEATEAITAPEDVDHPDSNRSVASVGSASVASAVAVDRADSQESFSASIAAASCTTSPSAVTTGGPDTQSQSSFNPSLLATPGSPAQSIASASSSLNNSSNPVNIAERSAVTFDYMIDNLKSGIIDDEKPLEDDDEEWDENNDDAVPLFSAS